jgi:ubiquinone/menaquinone biosynthesis C-methylase UbiE
MKASKTGSLPVDHESRDDQNFSQMITNRSHKELVFLYDLFVATDWGERFAELADKYIVLPEEGQALYLVSGTGGHAIALRERSGENLKFTSIDESEECLELARAKATAMNDPMEFRQGRIDALDLADNRFDFAFADASLIDPDRVPQMLAEMVRVVRPGGTIALNLATASSFAEFFSIYWEALYNCGLRDHESDIEGLISERLTVSHTESLAEREGLEEVRSWTRIEEFQFDSGEQFLDAPLISDFLMKDWLEFIPDSSRPRVAIEIARIINEERHNAEFTLSVKATLVMGRKSRSN